MTELNRQRVREARDQHARERAAQLDREDAALELVARGVASDIDHAYSLMEEGA